MQAVDLYKARPTSQIMDMEAPAAKRVNRGPLQSPSASDLDAGVEGSALSPHSEDVAHLEGLDRTFACSTNLILTVKDSDVTIGFPVHKDIISAHSSILCQFIGELRPSDGKPPQLPMVDDSCSALRQVLASIYGAFGHTEEPPASPEASMFHSRLWPEIADRLRLCHKYGMLKIRSAQEKSLMPSLMEYAKELTDTTVHTDQYDMVPVIASAAEECGCKDMLMWCEAFVVRYFHYYAMCQSQQLLSKLPPASMIRVSLGLAKAHKDTMSAVHKKLEVSVNETKECSYSLMCGSEPKCPRCGKALERIARRQPGTTLPSTPLHKDRNSWCQWPQQYFTEPSPKVADVAKYIASLHSDN